jgi:alpha(1,3/1,4) fucosyltransferase
MIKTIAYINYWNDPHNDNYFTKFIEENIGPVKKVNPKEIPDILIASCMGNINNVLTIKAKCKIFYYGENLNRYPPYNNDKLLYDTFDLIVGFKNTDLSKKQIRFPLWLMYYHYYKYNENDNILSYIQNKYNKNIKKQKDIFGSIISRHDRGGQRTIICNEVSKYGDIKAPGTYRKNTQSIGNTHNDKINYISKGTYNICPENSCYEGYFTEKIFQAFEGGTIPLYWAIDSPEPEIINKNKYCFCDINNKEELEKSIYNVCNNPNQYIDGELFTKNAGVQVHRFYSTLLENILLYVINT